MERSMRRYFCDSPARNSASTQPILDLTPPKAKLPLAEFATTANVSPPSFRVKACSVIFHRAIPPITRFIKLLKIFYIYAYQFHRPRTLRSLTSIEPWNRTPASTLHNIYFRQAHCIILTLFSHTHYIFYHLRNGLFYEESSDLLRSLCSSIDFGYVFLLLFQTRQIRDQILGLEENTPG